MESGKRKKSVFLSIADKLKVLDRLDAGCTVRNVAQEFGLGLTTVKDLKKNKEKLRSFSQRFDAGSNIIKFRKTMRRLPSEAIDEAVYKWYSQHRSSGISVRGTEILAAAERFAEQLSKQKFTFNSAWLCRFMNRHGLPGIRSCEAPVGDEAVEKDLFRQMMKEIIDQSNLSLAQVYNFDETGLLYCTLPKGLLSTQPDVCEEEQKLSKARLSALLCANANGSHRLKPVIVGKRRWPYAQNKGIQQLPAHYYHNPNAWFTWDIVKDWFSKYAEPEIRRFQIEDLKIVPDDVCALILIDRAPVHPESETLNSQDGRIKCLTIPPGVSLTQPMEQGIILSTKRLYRKKFLDEVLIFPEETSDEDHDMLEIRPWTNIKNYSLKDAILTLQMPGGIYLRPP
ncbi:tigger transposable element-derived protein 7-like [Portunus trituberculatus]|uniref:tigger transposable element-derived protein 7-like n=1 Tax=Portunus trituberculatus TaxID=210409 RepID=UPI001E1CECFA|nr:tigger transposable element-derived protein 7-like [Portunus trituberculatus]